MSLRAIAKIPSGACVRDDDNDDDPSMKKKPSTLDIVKRSTIWLFRTLHGQFCLALDYMSVDSRRCVRKTLAMTMNGLGFVYSVGVELLFTSRIQYKNQWLPLVEELNLFLQTSGISVELERGLFNYRFLSNIALLARIQDKIMTKNGATGVPPNLDRRRTCIASLPVESSISDNEKLPIQTSIIEDGRRFMSYATAAYGISMIDAAEIDVYGSVQTSKIEPSSTVIATGSNLLLSLKSSLMSLEPQKNKMQSVIATGSNFLLSLKSSLVSLEQQKNKLQSSSSFSENSFSDKEWLLGRISEHIGIPEENIYLMNLSDDHVETLRFFIAVDHINKNIVLSIRGSLTVKEIIIDIAGFSRGFCGGEAHSEMANAAERIWDVAKDMITKLLRENVGYELILTGHSLGAGAAALLNILLHENNCERVNGRAIRCFTYASPPVFTGEAKEARNVCINFIHDTDCVSFLSVDSVRHIFAALHTIEECNLSIWTRTRILWGLTEAIDPWTLQQVQNALHCPLPEKEGAPVLLIPAHVNIWMREVAHRLTVKEANNLSVEKLAELPSSSPSDSVLVDSEKLAVMGISFDPSMITNHFPNGYENALYNLQ
jgi:hypothetical protein